MKTSVHSSASLQKRSTPDSTCRLTNSATISPILRSFIIAVLPALLYACASPEPRPVAHGAAGSVAQIMKKTTGDRPYIVLGDKRYVSGPYGDKDDVMRVIAEVKDNSTPVHLSNRAVKLPNKPANLSLTVYSYVTPPECGAYKFHVYEGDELQILQYDFEEGIKPTIIRDYTVGPTQFVSAGLWGPYDHTESTAMEMCLLPGDSAKDGGGLIDSNYEIGWITSISGRRQAELGNEYASIVKTTSRCLQGLTVTPVVRAQYHVRPGDSLSGISQRVYGNTNGWKDIYEANRDLIGANPNTLPSGITLTIP